MSHLKTLTASALAITALAPMTASAAGVELRSAPSMRIVDAQTATLSFTTDERLTRKADGTYRIRISPAASRRCRPSSRADATATTTSTAPA